MFLFFLKATLVCGTPEKRSGIEKTPETLPVQLRMAKWKAEHIQEPRKLEWVGRCLCTAPEDGAEPTKAADPLAHPHLRHLHALTHART